MAKACFFCKPNNQHVCDGEHCGGCPAGDQQVDDVSAEALAKAGAQKPSERMYDGRSWIPEGLSADVSAEASAKAEALAEEEEV